MGLSRKTAISIHWAAFFEQDRSLAVPHRNLGGFSELSPVLAVVKMVKTTAVSKQSGNGRIQPKPGGLWIFKENWHATFHT